MGKFKDKLLLITGIIVFILVCIMIFFFNSGSLNIKKYKNNYYSFKYDSAWKLKKNKEEIVLTHKKSKGKITVTYKLLDTYLIDLKIKDILNDLNYEIEKQNKDYKLINREYNDKDDSYKLLYEKDNEECLVNIFKKDNVLLIVYYNSNTKYFDITMDSLDIILDTLVIYSGE